MINYSFSRLDSAVYPGQYAPIPHLDWAACEKQVSDLPYAMNESPDGYKVTIELPGFNKEDLLIHVDSKAIEIILLYKRTQASAINTEHALPGDLHETRVPLPRDADLEFITGEYNNGKLVLEVPRAATNLSQGIKEIVIY